MEEQPTVQVDSPSQVPQVRKPKRLYRPRERRMLLGVCAGLAEYFDSDPALMRALFAVTTLLAGVGVVIYLVLTLIMPDEEMVDADPRVAAQATVDQATDEIRRAVDRTVESVRGALGKSKPPVA
jgi:phage shock protein C